MNDSIQLNEVRTALTAIETNLDTIHAKIASVSGVAENLSGAWSSTNASNVKSYVAKMEDDLYKLYTSVGRIKGNVQTVAEAIKDADDVTINGGSSGSRTSQQTSSYFSQSSVQE